MWEKEREREGGEREREREREREKINATQKYTSVSDAYKVVRCP